MHFPYSYYLCRAPDIAAVEPFLTSLRVAYFFRKEKTYYLMSISNDDTLNSPSIDYNWLKRLNTQLNKLTNQNSIKVKSC